MVSIFVVLVALVALGILLAISMVADTIDLTEVKNVEINRNAKQLIQEQVRRSRNACIFGIAALFVGYGLLDCNLLLPNILLFLIFATLILRLMSDYRWMVGFKKGIYEAIRQELQNEQGKLQTNN